MVVEASARDPRGCSDCCNYCSYDIWRPLHIAIAAVGIFVVICFRFCSSCGCAAAVVVMIIVLIVTVIAVVAVGAIVGYRNYRGCCGRTGCHSCRNCCITRKCKRYRAKLSRRITKRVQLRRVRRVW